MVLLRPFAIAGTAVTKTSEKFARKMTVFAKDFQLPFRPNHGSKEELRTSAQVPHPGCALSNACSPSKKEGLADLRNGSRSCAGSNGNLNLHGDNNNEYRSEVRFTR